MKKGFTLAEMLIVLAIIGIIATMTLPALMTNIQEAQAKTAIKKAVSVFTQIATSNNAVRNYDYASIVSNDVGDEGEDSLYAMIASYGAIDLARSSRDNTETASDMYTSGIAAGATNGGNNAGAAANWMVFTFNDGSTLLYDPAAATADNVRTINTADGLPTGFQVIYDMNGPKAPNVLSNCSNTRNATIAQASGDDACTKESRVIRDQFLLQFRGLTVEPAGSASTWAYFDGGNASERFTRQNGQNENPENP